MNGGKNNNSNEAYASDGDRYIKIVSWSEQDKCFIGICPEVTSTECSGDDERKVFETLCNIVEETIALHRLLGKPLPGAVNLSTTNYCSAQSSNYSMHDTSAHGISPKNTSKNTSINISTNNKSTRNTRNHHCATDTEISDTTTSDTGTPYRYRSTLMSNQNRFLRHCGTRVRMS